CGRLKARSVHGDRSLGKAPGAILFRDPVDIAPDIGKLRRPARLPVIAVQVAAADDRAVGLALQMQAAVPVPPVFVPPATGIRDLECAKLFAALVADADGVDAQHTLLGEAGGIALRVTRIAAQVVVGVEVLDLAIVGGRKAVAGRHCSRSFSGLGSNFYAEVR